MSVRGKVRRRHEPSKRHEPMHRKPSSIRVKYKHWCANTWCKIRGRKSVIRSPINGMDYAKPLSCLPWVDEAGQGVILAAQGVFFSLWALVFRVSLAQPASQITSFLELWLGIRARPYQCNAGRYIYIYNSCWVMIIISRQDYPMEARGTTLLSNSTLAMQQSHQGLWLLFSSASDFLFWAHDNFIQHFPASNLKGLSPEHETPFVWRVIRALSNNVNWSFFTLLSLP